LWRWKFWLLLFFLSIFFGKGRGTYMRVLLLTMFSVGCRENEQERKQVGNGQSYIFWVPSFQAAGRVRQSRSDRTSFPAASSSSLSSTSIRAAIQPANQLDQYALYMLTWVRLPLRGPKSSWLVQSSCFCTCYLFSFSLSLCPCVLLVGCLCDVTDLGGSVFRHARFLDSFNRPTCSPPTIWFHCIIHIFSLAISKYLKIIIFFSFVDQDNRRKIENI
jgi:hypothetical protein